MSLVSSLFARKAIAQAPSALEPSTLLAIVELDLNTPEDNSSMVSEDAYCTLLETIADAEGDGIRFHVRLGASMRCEDLGAVGLAWRSSKTIFDGFERVVRYIGLLARPRLIELSQGEEETIVKFHRTTDEMRRGAQLSNEATFATMTAVCREASGYSFSPNRVMCAHKLIGDVGAFEAFLECPIEQETGMNAMVIDNAVMFRPNARGDDIIARFLDQYLAEKLPESYALGSDVPLERRVRIEIANALSAGVPKISDVALSMGLGTRTLQRKLSDQGIVYQTIIDEARRELAERLLASTDYPLIEVAFLTGFSEQSSFTRAFKRWAGQTPRSYRLASSTGQ